MAQSLARGAHANYSRACQVGLVKCKGPARAYCQPEQKCQVKIRIHEKAEKSNSK